MFLTNIMKLVKRNGCIHIYHAGLERYVRLNRRNVAKALGLDEENTLTLKELLWKVRFDKDGNAFLV